MDIEKLYIYAGHHQNTEQLVSAFEATFGQTNLPEKAGVTDPPRGHYSSKKMRTALTQGKLFCFGGSFKGYISANTLEKFGVVILIYESANESDQQTFINAGTDFITLLTPVFANMRVSTKHMPELNLLGSSNLQTVARVGLNGLSLRTWLGAQITQQIQPILSELGVATAYQEGTRIDLLDNPFAQTETSLIAASERCILRLERFGMRCDDSKAVDALWRKAPNWQSFNPYARPNSYLIEHTINGGAEALPTRKDHANALDAVVDLMRDMHDPRRSAVQDEAVYLLQSDNPRLRSAACVLFRYGYGRDYSQLVTLLNEQRRLYEGVFNPWTNDQDLRAVLATALSTHYNKGNYKQRKLLHREIMRPGYGGCVLRGMIENEADFVINNALEIARQTPSTIRTMLNIFSDLNLPLDKLVGNLAAVHAEEVGRILGEINQQ